MCRICHITQPLETSGTSFFNVSGSFLPFFNHCNAVKTDALCEDASLVNGLSEAVSAAGKWHDIILAFAINPEGRNCSWMMDSLVLRARLGLLVDHWRSYFSLSVLLLSLGKGEY